ncbi:MAG: 3-dehydroquinate synthase II [Candidatus Methanofastidiosia archaeon]
MKKIFIRISGSFSKKRIIPLLEAGICDFIVSSESLKRKIEKISVSNVLLEKDFKVFELEKKEDEERILNSERKNLFVRATNWKIIPFENLVARKKDLNLYAVVSDTTEAEALLEVLEKGVDGVVFENQKTEDVKKFLKKLGKERFILQKATVKRIENVGSGERVCIDTTSIFRKGEGLLVGNFSRGLFLIHSENVESEWASPRPFRVNCGAVHCYVLCDGKTKYLSEVKAGDLVKAVSADGKARNLTVGRAKVEKRPLSLLSAEIFSDEVSVIVQNAETIRFVTPSGPKSLSRLREKDKVLVYHKKVGRHFGIEIDEFIEER